MPLPANRDNQSGNPAIKGANQSVKGDFFMYDIQYCFICRSLRFHCVEGCWDRTQDSCYYGIGCQTFKHSAKSHAYSARSYPLRTINQLTQLQRGYQSVHLPAYTKHCCGSGMLIMNPNFSSCGSGMFIPDPNFSIPDTESTTAPDPDPGSATKNLSILTPKNSC